MTFSEKSECTLLYDFPSNFQSDLNTFHMISSVKSGGTQKHALYYDIPKHFPTEHREHIISHTALFYPHKTFKYNNLEHKYALGGARD